MTTVPTVLVPIDIWATATATLPVARGLAQLKGATVVLIHVGHEASSPGELLDAIGLSREDIRGLVIDQCTGSPADAIVREAAARNAIFIVMSAARPDCPSYPIGSVPGHVMQMASCPVVFAPSSRGKRPWTLRHLVLPHDGTPTSAAAIAPTSDLASRAGADLVILHVATPSGERPAEPGTLALPHYLDQPQHEWPMWGEEFLKRTRSLCDPADVAKIRLVLAHGEVGAAVLDFAQRNMSDLIALAWRGSLELERAQTIRRVIRDATCPVVVFCVQA
jgi:nucleotide-binding universal stress UspA family protein